MSCKISKIAYYLPETVLANEQLSAEFPDWTPEKIEEKIGVRERRIAADDETALDLALAACERIFAENEIGKSEIDFLLLCTQSPDYYLPTSSCILQDKLGLRTDIGAFDFNLGCSGFVYGLAAAKGLIAGIAFFALANHKIFPQCARICPQFKRFEILYQRITHAVVVKINFLTFFQFLPHISAERR
ncbi:hypothetical protein FACS189429_8490 [Bacteroidia bacterium]|nr:hypothetical protein FACS189429_8490 [Bacteroidia bacterium]